MTCTATRHGTASAYTRFGCRCLPAVQDKKRQEYARQHGRYRIIDSTGTRRRLQALIALGWPGRELMARMGWEGAALGTQFYGERVHITTAAKVRQLYDELADLPGTSIRSRNRALRNGWPPPIAWDDDTIDDPTAEPWDGCSSRTGSFSPAPQILDEVAIERALRGEPVSLTVPERTEAIRRLHERGESVTSIAHRLHMSNARVCELLQREEGAA